MLSAEEIMLLRRKTGMPIWRVRELAASAPAELLGRMLEACRTQRMRRYKDGEAKELPWEVRDREANLPEVDCLVDPVQFDAVQGPIVQQVMKEEMENIPGTEYRRGICYLIWRRTRERLEAEYGIRWYSPAEMNPGSCFD